MAKQPATYNDDVTYDVKLSRAASYRGAPLLPLPVHEMTGRAVMAIIEQEGADAIDSAVAQ